jgi:hypothetical protein
MSTPSEKMQSILAAMAELQNRTRDQLADVDDLLNEADEAVWKAVEEGQG